MSYKWFKKHKNKFVVPAVLAGAVYEGVQYVKYTFNNFLEEQQKKIEVSLIYY